MSLTPSKYSGAARGASPAVACRGSSAQCVAALPLEIEIYETPSQPGRVSRAHLALATEDETLCVVISTCWVEGRLRCCEAVSPCCKHVALQLRRSELVHGERVNHDIGSKASGAQLTAASGDRTDEALLSA